VPTQIYRTKDGVRVPSVTTIIGRFKESGGLIHWAWALGMEGKDYRQVRDSAADAGSLAHSMIYETNHGNKIGMDKEGNVYAGTMAEMLEKGLTVIS